MYKHVNPSHADHQLQVLALFLGEPQFSSLVWREPLVVVPTLEHQFGFLVPNRRKIPPLSATGIEGRLVFQAVSDLSSPTDSVEHAAGCSPIRDSGTES